MSPQLDPGLRRLLAAARRKREQRGTTGDGTVVVAGLGAGEALAIDGLLAPSKPVLAGQRRRFALSQIEAALRDCDIDPRSAYETVGNGLLRDFPAEREAARQGRVDLRSWLAEHPVSQRYPRVVAWLDEAARQGRITRSLVEPALAIVAALPACEPVQRTVLAATLLDGDPHGLDGHTPLHRLTVTLLTVAAGREAEDLAPRDVWGDWGVTVDPISSNVTALNLPPPTDERLASLLTLTHGSHVVLTYGQLAGAKLRWGRGLDCFTCENPSVLIAAEHALGSSCPPLVCTGGRPSDATRRLLGALRQSGTRIHHHGDFDLAGVQILRDLEARYDAVPWRFDIASLAQALDDPVEPAPSTLEEAVSRMETGLAEELMIDGLLEDLSRIADGTSRDSRTAEALDG